jgi:hypothetical protein
MIPEYRRGREWMVACPEIVLLAFGEGGCWKVWRR